MKLKGLIRTHKVTTVIAGIITAILIICIIFSIKFSIKNDQLVDEVEIEVGSKAENERPNADAYYEENAELIDSYSILQSKDVLTEKSIENILNERGFLDYPIYFEYSMDGEYKGTIETSGLDEKHPTYQTYYVTKNNEIWTIMVINDSIVANPVTYNMQEEKNAQVIFTETDIITSYDSATNKFYESIPNESEVIVKKVNKIEANTLEKLTGMYTQMKENQTRIYKLLFP